MIAPVCGMCDNELTEPGGLLIGAPEKMSESYNLVLKEHLCVGCLDLIWSVVTGRNVVTAAVSQ